MVPFTSNIQPWQTPNLAKAEEDCRSHDTSGKQSTEHRKTKLECPYCDKAFSQKSEMIVHLSKSHSGDKKHQCEHCLKRFTKRQNLQSHLRIHTGEQPFQCKLCGKAFARQNNLSRHLNIHTGSRPHQCKYCRKRFVSKSNLKSHLVVHGERILYHCTFCGKDFKSTNYFKKHLDKHKNSGDAPIIGDTCPKTRVIQPGFKKMTKTGSSQRTEIQKKQVKVEKDVKKGGLKEAMKEDAEAPFWMLTDEDDSSSSTTGPNSPSETSSYDSSPLTEVHDFDEIPFFERMKLPPPLETVEYTEASPSYDSFTDSGSDSDVSSPCTVEEMSTNFKDAVVSEKMMDAIFSAFETAPPVTSVNTTNSLENMLQTTQSTPMDVELADLFASFSDDALKPKTDPFRQAMR